MKDYLKVLRATRATMDGEVRAEWIKALRSGKYKQGTGVLWNGHHDTFCCLGVLCDIQGQDLTAWDGAVLMTSFVPPAVDGHLSAEAQAAFASANDNGATFAQIADLIEQGVPARA